MVGSRGPDSHSGGTWNEDNDGLIAIDGTGSGIIQIPDAHLMFSGDYSRAGNDLLISGENTSNILVTGYFNHDNLPTLSSPNGAWLQGGVVRSLAGPRAPGQYAQAGNDAGSGDPIGQVETLAGTATATRTDGTVVELAKGDLLYQGDVISTGNNSKLDIVLVDETVFSMSAEARMVLDDLVYNPGAEDNSMVVSLVQGGFAFVTGQIAPAGDMQVNTPVATMGIRGTAPTVEISSEDGTVRFSLVPDPSGEVGRYTLSNPDTGEVFANVIDTGNFLRFEGVDGSFQTFAKTAEDLVNDQVVQNQVAQIYNVVQQRIASGENVFTQSSSGSNSGNGANNSGDPGNGENGEGITPLDGQTLNTDPTGNNGTGNNNSGEGGDESSAAPKVNSPPTADSLSGIIDEDGPTFSIDLLVAANAADFDGDPLSVTQPDSIVSTAEGRLLVLGVDYTVSGSTFALTASGFDKFNSLGEGETDTLIFNYTVFDNQVYKPADGIPLTVNSLTIVANGTNDLPLIQVVDVEGTILEGTTLSDTGSITFTDVDLTDRPVASEATKTVTALAQDGISALPLTAGQQADIEAAFTIVNVPSNTNNGTVTWNYTIAETALDFLGEGEKVTASFTITVTDDEGAIAEEDVTVVIDGKNDGPAIQIVDARGDILEGTTLSDNGSITFTDVDLTDRPVAIEATKTVTALAQDGISALPLTAGQQADIEAAFTIINVPSNTNNGTVTWNYTIAEAALDFLGEGEKVTASFTITVTDDEGAIAEEDVTVVIDGKNDGPAIQIVDARGDILEGTTLTDSGSVTYTDVDLTDRPTAMEVTKTVTAIDQDGVTPIVLTGPQQTAIEDAFTITQPVTNVNDGAVNWNYTITEANLDFLGTGDKVTATFTIKVTDDEGAIAEEDVSVIIIGTNDTPVVTAGGTLNYRENDAATAIDNTITVADVDDTNIESATVQITAGHQNGEDILGFTDQNSITGNFNALTGILTLTGAATLAQYQAALASVTYANSSDDPNTAARTVTTIVSDGEASSTSVTSTINVEAVNDAPEILGATSSTSVDEDTTLNLTNLAINDLDAGANPILVTFNVTNGDLAFAGATTDLVFSDSDGSDGSLAFSGSQADINTALGLGLQYIPDLDFNGVANLDIIADDQGQAGTDPGTTGTASNETDSATLNITVNPVADAPNNGGVTLAGTSGDDVFLITDDTFNLIDGMGGTDTIALDGAFNIDFTNILNLRTMSIEAINASNGAANTVTVDIDDIVDFSDSENDLLALVFGGTAPANSFVIGADGNDHVFLTDASGDGAWSASAATLAGYQIYTYTDGAGTTAAVAIGENAIVDGGGGLA